MKKYTIGLITGALLAISAMMFIGAQNKNLGEITVEKITLRKEGGKKMCVIQGDGLIVIDETAITSIFSGKVLTHNADGKMVAYIGTSEGGSGFLETYNKHGVKTGYFGTDNNNDGVAGLFDRYGDEGWSAEGKQ
jgi:hypothetical protein